MNLPYMPWVLDQIRVLKASLPYLVPDNPISFVTVLVAIILFIVFVNTSLKQLSQELEKETKELSLLSDLEFVHRCASERHVTKAQKAILVQRLFYIVLEAGQQESRLEVQELTALAEETYERRIDALKTFVSSFIVIGLLGTLFGLAYSFGNLSSYMSEYDTIKGLLPGLRSAFAPSIWGVSFTLIGLYFHNRLISKRYNPFITRLRETIVSVWVPILYPTSPQKWAQILQDSASGLHTVLEDISKNSKISYDQFAKHVGQMTQNLTALNDILGDTEEVTKRFKIILNAVEKTSKSLADALQKLTDSQDDIKKLSERFADVTKFQISNWDDQVAAFHRQYSAIQQLIAVVGSQIDRVTGVITEGFDNTNETMKVLPGSLHKIQEELARLGDPLMNSSGEIHTTFVNFTKYVETEFQPWVKQILDKVDIQSRIDDLKTSLEGYLKILPSIETEWKERKASAVTKDQVELIGTTITKNTNNIMQHLESFQNSMKPVDIEGPVRGLESVIQKTFLGIALPNERLGKMETTLREILTSTKEVATKLKNLKKYAPSKPSAPGSIWTTLFKR